MNNIIGLEQDNKIFILFRDKEELTYIETEGDEQKVTVVENNDKNLKQLIKKLRKQLNKEKRNELELIIGELHGK